MTHAHANAATSIVAILLLGVGMVLLGGGLVVRLIIHLNGDTFDDEPPESWPYLSERHWLYAMVCGGSALIGLGLQMLIGVV